MEQQISAYQKRLRQLVVAAQKHHAPKGKKQLSIRGLGRLMDGPSVMKPAAYAKISLWLCGEVGRIERESLEQLAIIDPQQRMPEEIQYWLETGKAMPTEMNLKLKVARGIMAEFDTLLLSA
ncbi:MAG: hypothetical protein AAF329_01960 [Cyanobacteria bacterium P01_A01_bin.17]